MEPTALFVARFKQWIEVFMRHSMRSFIRYAQRNDLNMTQTAALFHILRKGQCNITTIADEIGITNPAVSQLVERLVQQGLVARSENPGDRRLKQIVLTARGETILQEGIHARLQMVEELATLLTPDELEQCIGALEILLNKTAQLESQSTPEI